MTTFWIVWIVAYAALFGWLLSDTAAFRRWWAKLKRVTGL